MSKVYIAGPMSGIDGFNRKAFFMAATAEYMAGNVVLNPAILPDGLSQAEYMSICLQMVLMADEILMLDGWELSDGATAERALAIKLGIGVRETDHRHMEVC